MIKFIDLFAGIGGIRLGVVKSLEQHGIDSKCVLSSEIDEKACETYKANFGSYPSGDVRKITKIEPFDLLLAGIAEIRKKEKRTKKYSLANLFLMRARERGLEIHAALSFLKLKDYFLLTTRKLFFWRMSEGYIRMTRDVHSQL